jgi:hypothetical protein
MARVIDLFSPGSGLAQGLGTGIQQLAQHKIGEMVQQKRAAGLQSLFPNFNQQQAAGLAQQSPQVQQQYIKSILEGNQRGAFTKALSGIEGGEEQQNVLDQLTPKQASEYTKIKQAQRRQEFAEQSKIRPFIQKQFERYNSEKKIKDKVEQNLQLLKKYPDKFKKFSTIALSKAPEAIRSLLQRDPILRQYDANTNEIVTLKGQSRRGLPSKYKLTLEELAKAGLSQPYETQIAINEDFLGHFNEEKMFQKYLHSLSDKNGNYPANIEALASDYLLALDDPLDFPQYFKEGQRYEDDDGVIHIIRNGKWEDE